MASSIGYFFGAFLATAGCGYILLGFLWVVRVYSRWPKASYWIAAAFALFLGLITASAERGFLPASLMLIASLFAAAFIIWRNRRIALNIPPA